MFKKEIENIKTTPYNVNGVRGKKWIFKTNEDWRQERSHSIGASAIGTIIGANPFQTPLELAMRMRAELRGEYDYTETLAMKRGHAYEQGVADLFEWKTGLQVIKASSREFLLRRDDTPYLHASLDRTYWIDDEGMKHGINSEQNKGVLECKTTRMPVDADHLPTSWLVQLQAEMGESGYKEGYIAWDQLSIADGFGYKKFEFSQDMFDTIMMVCEDFWRRCVIGGEDPEPISTKDIISRWPKSVEGKTITANADTIQLIEEVKEMKDVEKNLKAEIEEKVERIKAEFTDEEAMVDMDGNVLATYKTTAGRSSVDSKKLKAEYAEAYAACLKQTAGSRSLIIK